MFIQVVIADGEVVICGLNGHVVPVRALHLQSGTQLLEPVRAAHL
jgi:hypothetical protein